jgi:hypothetical protein
VEFAAYQFQLAAEEEGGSVLEHLLAAQAQTGQTPQALLDAPPCPDDCEELWRMFNDLHESRSWANGPGRISFTDLDAFQRVTGVTLQRWELEAIRKADSAYLEQYAERNAVE